MVVLYEKLAQSCVFVYLWSHADLCYTVPGKEGSARPERHEDSIQADPESFLAYRFLDSEVRCIGCAVCRHAQKRLRQPDK